MTRPARRRRGAVAALAAGVVLAGTVAAAPPALAADPVTITLGSGALTITGDDTANVVALRLLAGDPDHLVVDLGDDGTADSTLARSGFDRIDIDTGDGDDTVRIDDVNGTFTDTEATTIDGGRGADTLTGGAGGETIAGQAGPDTIDAGGGADTVTGGDHRDTIDAGPGDDHVRWSFGDDADLRADGGGGEDVLEVTGTADADRLVVGSDALTRPTDAQLLGFNRIEQVATDLRGGDDHLTVLQVPSSPMWHVDADLGGDGSADTVELDGDEGLDDLMIGGSAGTVSEVGNTAPSVGITGAEPSLDRLLVELHGTADFLSAATLAADTLALEVHGGDGDDIVEGGAGDDVLRGGADDDTLTGGPGTDTLDGGTGTDTLIQ